MAHLTFPLRGLAGEGAQPIVDRALGGLAGVRSARAGGDQLLHIVFDDALVSPAEIHAALARAGIVHVADAEPHTGEGTPSARAGQTPDVGVTGRG